MKNIVFNFIKRPVSLNEGSQLKKTIDYLIENRKSAVNSEKIKKFPKYTLLTARINDADRLLYTKKKYKGKTYLVLVDLILNHDHRKSPYMYDGVLDRFMEKNHDILIAAIEAQENEGLDEALPSATENLKLIKVEYYKQHFLFLNERQDRATQLNTPLLINGGPGSGKTVLALRRLKQAIEQWDGRNQGSLLYLATSEYVVRDMQELWDALPQSEKGENINVEFKTYQQFLESHLAEPIDKKQIPDDKFFTDWLRQYRNKVNKQAKLNNFFFNRDILAKSEVIYREFRIISGYVDDNFNDEGYLSLGSMRSLFTSKEERGLLVRAYGAYMAHLAANNKIDLSFYRINPQKNHQMIVFDEGHDASHLQAKQVLESALDYQFIMFVDTHQLFWDLVSIRPYLDELCKQRKLILENIVLPGSYRCPYEVGEFLNALIDLKAKVTHCGLMDNMGDIRRISYTPRQKEHLGETSWYSDSSNQDFMEKITPYLGSTDLVILTYPEFFEDAKRHFPHHSLILTPVQAKGLEYKKVLLYRPFDRAIFHQINTKLATCITEKISEYRAKILQDDEFSIAINLVIVAASRALDELIVIQGNNNKFSLTEINSYLQRVINSSLIIPARLKEPIAGTRTSESWLKEFELQFARKNDSVALNIFINDLGYSKELFDKKVASRDNKESVNMSNENKSKPEENNGLKESPEENEKKATLLMHNEKESERIIVNKTKSKSEEKKEEPVLNKSSVKLEKIENKATTKPANKKYGKKKSTKNANPKNTQKKRVKPTKMEWKKEKRKLKEEKRKEKELASASKIIAPGHTIPLEIIREAREAVKHECYLGSPTTAKADCPTGGLSKHYFDVSCQMLAKERVTSTNLYLNEALLKITGVGDMEVLGLALCMKLARSLTTEQKKEVKLRVVDFDDGTPIFFLHIGNMAYDIWKDNECPVSSLLQRLCVPLEQCEIHSEINIPHSPILSNLFLDKFTDLYEQTLAKSRIDNCFYPTLKIVTPNTFEISARTAFNYNSKKFMETLTKPFYKMDRDIATLVQNNIIRDYIFLLDGLRNNSLTNYTEDEIKKALRSSVTSDKFAEFMLICSIKKQEPEKALLQLGELYHSIDASNASQFEKWFLEWASSPLNFDKDLYNQITKVDEPVSDSLKKNEENLQSYLSGAVLFAQSKNDRQNTYTTDSHLTI